MFGRMRARIEAAVPAPRVLVVRNANADRNRTDVHVAEINVPAFMAVVCGSAAGEGGHVSIQA